MAVVQYFPKGFDFKLRTYLRKGPVIYKFSFSERDPLYTNSHSQKGTCYIQILILRQGTYSMHIIRMGFVQRKIASTKKNTAPKKKKIAKKKTAPKKRKIASTKKTGLHLRRKRLHLREKWTPSQV